MSWDGIERRSVEHDLSEIKRLLQELNSKVEAHLTEEKQIQPHLIELIDILQKSKGVVLLFKFLLYIGAPFAALVYWIKDHVKL